MIDSHALRDALKPWVLRFEKDLLARTKEDAALLIPFQERYQEAKTSKRTAFTFSQWFEGERTQIAVAWVLACVFARFLEDNELIETPYLAGPGARMQEAEDQHVLYFREHPNDTERDYLLYLFTELARLPGLDQFFDQAHNPLWQLGPTGNLCREFLFFWRTQHEVSGNLVHDFSDEEWRTRFLGDLYQDLSEAARKRYALLQTPDFVEEFILDRTLTPAIETYGFREVRLIDPTCGSGHFLLGAFERLFHLWQQEELEENPRVLAQNALNGVYGVDLNPFAVSIARFRLLIAALRASGDVSKLRNAPAFRINLAVGDSLLHGRRFRNFEGEERRQEFLPGDEDAFHDETRHFYEVEDQEKLHRILGQQYHAVVANPPYITVKDKALNQIYRDRFDSCYRQYSLSVPFMERIFDLTLAESNSNPRAGFCGQITSNSFMKREFGKKLITEFIKEWDLTHVIDTSGAYIPGHGTPTVILFGRNQSPCSPTVLSVLGIKGEPSPPEDPSNGVVWTSIVDMHRSPGQANEFISVSLLEREFFQKHPWSLSGGRASQLKAKLENSESLLEKFIDNPIGRSVRVSEEEVFFRPNHEQELKGVSDQFRPYQIGTELRDWHSTKNLKVWYPYALQNDSQKTIIDKLWLHRRILSSRATFSGPVGNSRNWYEYQQHTPSAYFTPLSIAFSEIATHNHFVLDRGGKVFKQTAPVIKLPAGASEIDHLHLLGPLNSSTACFWMKQVFHNKGDSTDSRGARVSGRDPFVNSYQHDGTKLKKFPLPADSPLTLARELDRLAQELANLDPAALTTRDAVTAEDFAEAKREAEALHGRMIALQEESDWACYRYYDLCGAEDALEWSLESLTELPSLNLGERAFEIAMAREMEAGQLETTWFERHAEAGSRPITKFPAHWPTAYRELVECRLSAIAENKDLNLIERPEYKRRWNTEPWEERQEEALRQWLLARLEGYFLGGERVCPLADGFRPSNFPAHTQPALVSLQELAEAVAGDGLFLRTAALYLGQDGFDTLALLTKLCLPESVPTLPLDRYKATGLNKRKDWEETWRKQRHEDEVEGRVRAENPNLDSESLQKLIRKTQLEEVGELTVPPKYGQKDFAKASYWKMRGKLDVPKERWISYPGLERDYSADTTPLLAWAGWDHAQQAKALGETYIFHKDNSGWEPHRLAPALAGLAELLPWLHQWHSEHDIAIGMSWAQYFQGYLEEEARELGYTMDQIDSFRHTAVPEPAID